MAVRHDAGRRRSATADRTTRRAVSALLISTAIVFAATAAGSVTVAHWIAHDEELAEAVRTAQAVGRAVFAPLLPGAIGGDPAAVAALDDAIRIRSGDGSLVRVKVWLADGRIGYSDDHTMIGRAYPLSAKVRDALERGGSTAAVSGLDDPDNAVESASHRRLVEAYVPLELSDGTRVAFETYSSDARLTSSEARLVGRLRLWSVGALLTLVLLQLPVGVALVRRAGRQHRDRSRLLGDALSASERERRAIARDLHDGVVQDLAGAGYVLGAAAAALPDDGDSPAAGLLRRGQDAITGSIGQLRTLIVDLHPPALTPASLADAVRELAARLGRAAGVDVRVEIEPIDALDPAVASTVYRTAREALANVAKHAQAAHVLIRITASADHVRLDVVDDGRGLPATGIDRRRDGHLGLTLLADAAADLGGRLVVGPAPAGGTALLLDLPGGRNA